MRLKCKTEAIDDNGLKIMHFTKGQTYLFGLVSDPEGWETFDDKGNKEVFFNPYIMFETV